MATTQQAIDRIAWAHEWDEAARRARNERRLLLIDVEKDN